MIDCKIIASGSDGNGVILNGNVMIDCGVSFKRIEQHMPGIRLVLLTHSHSDHFRKATVKRIVKDYPSVRFGAGAHMLPLLNEIPGIHADIMVPGTAYGYGICTVEPVELVHNVPNYGWKVKSPEGRAIYCTDTNSLEGVEAVGYDLYLIEANHGEAEIERRISEKISRGEYSYEVGAKQNHLSREKAEEFIRKNMRSNGRCIYMHKHRERCHDSKRKNHTQWG